MSPCGLTSLQRIATKDSERISRETWIEPVAWRDRLPRDIAIQERLRAQNHNNIHRYRGYRLNMQQRRYRVYNDVCEYLNFWWMLPYYLHNGGADNLGDDSHIPEDFLWYLFNQLATACTVLKNGNGVNMDGNPWKPIVHKDLHMGNIFVCPPLDEDGQPDPRIRGRVSTSGEEELPGLYELSRQEV